MDTRDMTDLGFEVSDGASMDQEKATLEFRYTEQSEGVNSGG